MWLFGKEVPGGKVYGRWGGLSPNALHEQRDLPTTTDFRAVLSSILGDHMKLSSQQLANIFPNFRLGLDPFVRS